MEMCMLTTTDNPYDPFTQYEAWYRLMKTTAIIPALS